jgi:flagellar hook-basal body complex protein FliE
MSVPILPVSVSIPAIAPLSSPAQSPVSSGGFQSAFADAVAKVEDFQNKANASVERFLSGEGEELHHVAIAAQQAELSFEMFMQVRNKIVTAYQQMMQMQI